MRRSRHAFTLAELLVSIAVLTLLVLFVGSMVNSAANVVSLGNKRMDSDSQVRPILDRMGVDFAQMIRRPDVDYYVKGLDPETGNDRIAFFSNVQGYYPSTGSQSPLSLVAYRINSDTTTSASLNRMERMGKGLLWSSVSPTPTPAPSPSPAPSPNPPWIIFGPAGTLLANWPSATLGDPTNSNYKHPDYELVGPQIFRFEYFYILKTGVIANTPGAAGMQDVAAIVAAVATIDPKSRVLLTDCQVGGNGSCGAYTNNGLVQRMVDFTPATQAKIADLTAAWQGALNLINDMPRPAIAGIRIYQRTFYLSH